MRCVLVFICLVFGVSVKANEELVIVASPIEASLSGKKCSEYVEKEEDSKYQIICMDRVFDISYKVYEVLAGNFEGGTIKGIDFYHYSGLPDHMIVDPACVTFRRELGQFIHVETAPAQKTKTGYTCGST